MRWIPFVIAVASVLSINVARADLQAEVEQKGTAIWRECQDRFGADKELRTMVALFDCGAPRIRALAVDHGFPYMDLVDRWLSEKRLVFMRSDAVINEALEEFRVKRDAQKVKAQAAEKLQKHDVEIREANSRFANAVLERYETDYRLLIQQQQLANQQEALRIQQRLERLRFLSQIFTLSDQMTNPQQRTPSPAYQPYPSPSPQRTNCRWVGSVWSCTTW